MVYYFTTANMT